MKLAYVLGEFPSVSETFILREITELRRRGFEIIVFALRRPAGGTGWEAAGEDRPPVCYRPPWWGWTTLVGVVAWSVRHPIRVARALVQAVAGAWPWPVAVLRCLRHMATACVFARRARSLGIRHVHAHFASLPTDVARGMAVLLGTEFSFSAHAADIFLQPGPLLARKVRAARFVTVCTRHGMEELARRMGVASPNVHLVRHGVPRLAAAAGSGKHDALIVSVSRLQPKKGLVTLVEACRLLHERGVAFRCTIVGEGPLRSELEAAVARSHLQGVVKLAGTQSQAQVADLLAGARVFALPCTIAPDGDHDGLPNALLEAMAAGLPVVSTPIGGITEAVDDGGNGFLVPPSDAAALAGRLEELLKNESLCRTLGASGQVRATEHFDIASNVAPLASLFERMRQAE